MSSHDSVNLQQCKGRCKILLCCYDWYLHKYHGSIDLYT